MVVLEKKGLNSSKSSCILAKRSYSDKLVVFGQKWWYSSKKWFYSGNKVVHWQKWLYSGKEVVLGQNWL